MECIISFVSNHNYSKINWWSSDNFKIFIINRSATSSSSNTPNKNGNVQTSLDKFGLDQNSKSNKFGHVDHNEDSVQSNGAEVDRQLLSMMSENSVDFTSKFAKLASAVVGSNVEDTWSIPKIP